MGAIKSGPKERQMSESLRLGSMLVISDGFMDAYSYLYREHVFANAQTGNMLLLGINLSQRDFAGAFKYLCPVLAFTLGIIISDFVRHKQSTKRYSSREFSENTQKRNSNYESGTISEAAEKLFISQPSLTNSMKELERESIIPLNGGLKFKIRKDFDSMVIVLDKQ